MCSNCCQAMQAITGQGGVRNIMISHIVLLNMSSTTNLDTEFTGHCGEVAMLAR